MFKPTGSRTSPERVGRMVRSLNPWWCWRCLHHTKVYQPKAGRLGAAKLSPFLVSQGWSYNCDASWKSWFLGGVYCKVSDNAQFSLMAVGEERFHPTGLPALLLGKGEGQPSRLCLSRSRTQTGASALHSRQGDCVRIQSGHKALWFCFDFQQVLIYLFEYPLVILQKWRFFSVLGSCTKSNEAEKWFSHQATRVLQDFHSDAFPSSSTIWCYKECVAWGRKSDFVTVVNISLSRQRNRWRTILFFQLSAHFGRDESHLGLTQGEHRPEYGSEWVNSAHSINGPISGKRPLF